MPCTKVLRFCARYDVGSEGVVLVACMRHVRPGFSPSFTTAAVPEFNPGGRSSRSELLGSRCGNSLPGLKHPANRLPRVQPTLKATATLQATVNPTGCSQTYRLQPSLQAAGNPTGCQPYRLQSFLQAAVNPTGRS